jgi:hypothetical protein
VSLIICAASAFYIHLGGQVVRGTVDHGYLLISNHGTPRVSTVPSSVLGHYVNGTEGAYGKAFCNVHDVVYVSWPEGREAVVHRYQYPHLTKPLGRP